MIVQPHSALFSATSSARAASPRQNFAELPANITDTVSISQTARDLYATQAGPVTSTGGNARAEYDTSKGTLKLDIEAYFTPPAAKALI